MRQRRWGALAVGAALAMATTTTRADEPVTVLTRIPLADVPPPLTGRPASATGNEPPVPEAWVDFEHRPQVLEARDGCFVNPFEASGLIATLVMPDTFRLIRIDASPDGPALVIRDGIMDGRMQTHVVASRRVPLAVVARAEHGAVAYAYRTADRLVVLASFGVPPPANEIPECRLVMLSLDLRRRGGDEAHVEHAANRRRNGSRGGVAGQSVRLDASTSRVRADQDLRLAVGLRVEGAADDDAAHRPSQ